MASTTTATTTTASTTASTTKSPARSPCPPWSPTDKVIGCLLLFGVAWRGSWSLWASILAALFLIGMVTRAYNGVSVPPGVVGWYLSAFFTRWRHQLQRRRGQGHGLPQHPPHEMNDEGECVDDEAPVKPSADNAAWQRCGHKRCTKPVALHRSGHVEDFCSARCASSSRHRTMDVMRPFKPVCRYYDKATSTRCRRTCAGVTMGGKSEVSDFCTQHTSDCAAIAGRRWLYEVPLDDYKAKNVLSQYKKTWLHSNRTPLKVDKVFIVTPQARYQAEHKAYQFSSGLRDVKVFAPGTIGNTQRRFHGTRVAATCRLGAAPAGAGQAAQTEPCDSTECPVCCIIRGRFDCKHVGKATGRYRFGRGIYTSATSSKGCDPTYAKPNPTTNKTYMFAVSVTLGKVHAEKEGNKHWNKADYKPPDGYHSVVADKENTNGMNFDEAVVYRNEAVLPLYLLVLSPAPATTT